MYWGLSGASRSTEEGSQIHVGTLLGLVCSLLGARDGVGTEADGLPQPPRGLGRRLALCFLTFRKQNEAAEAAKTSGTFWHIKLGHRRCGGTGAQRV